MVFAIMYKLHGCLCNPGWRGTSASLLIGSGGVIASRARRHSPVLYACFRTSGCWAWRQSYADE